MDKDRKLAYTVTSHYIFKVVNESGVFIVKSLIVFFFFSCSSFAKADMYMDCVPKSGVGTRPQAGKLMFDSSGSWTLIDGNVQVKGILRGDPEGRGFVVRSRGGNISGTYIYKFFSGNCDSYGKGGAQAYFSKSTGTVLLNSYACQCAID